jgi:cyanophycinase-like exopeptidase
VTRLLVLIGSGETTPSMVTTHQRVLDAVRDGGRDDPRDAVMVDSPYGFQENADELSARAIEYFARNVGHAVSALRLRSAVDLDEVAHEDALATARTARWLFAGPGSPTYMAGTWLATRLPTAVRDRLRGEGTGIPSATATVFASAAACTVGSHTVPVYEIYKAGAPPHWVPGLDLLAPLGLEAVVVPHFDNGAGGTHDTRFCFMGERRLRTMEDQLPDTTWVLGIDEHTAIVIDLDEGSARIEGRGGVTVRTRDASRTFPAGRVIGIEDLHDAAAGRDPSGSRSTRPTRTPTVGTDAGAVDEVATHVSPAARFEAAIDAHDLLAAAAVTLELTTHGGTDEEAAEELRRQVVALARLAQEALHQHRDLVAPHVEVLLQLRETARAERRFADADAIRDALTTAGVEVRDGSDGSSWEFHDPIEAARRA